MLFALVVAVLAWLATQLGQWQFHRLDDRKQDNRIVATNLKRPPAPVDDVLSTEQAPGARGRVAPGHGARDVGRRAHGRAQVPDPRRGRRGRRGHPAGHRRRRRRARRPRLDVHREHRRRAGPTLPAVDAGQVTVTGWVRRDATGGATKVSDACPPGRSPRARIAEVMPYPLYRGFVDLAEESPPPGDRARADRAARRHQQRAALLLRAAVVVLRGAGDLRVLLPGLGRVPPAPRSGRTRQSARSMPPSTGSITPVTKDDAGLSRKAAAAANSSGRP